MATYSKIKGDTALYLPVVTIMPWAKSNQPTGFLYCDGSPVSRTTYADLFALVGTTFGSGNGSSTFNLPDFQDRSAVGESGNRAFASKNSTALADKTPNVTFGSASVSVTSNHNIATANQNVDVPAHTHFISSNDSSNVDVRNNNLQSTHVMSEKAITGSLNEGYHLFGKNTTNATVGKTSVTGGNSNGSHAHTINGSVTSAFNQSSLAATASAVDIENPYLAIRYMIKF